MLLLFTSGSLCSASSVDNLSLFVMLNGSFHSRSATTRLGNIAAKNKDWHLHHGNVLNITEKAKFPLISNKLSCVSCPLVEFEMLGLSFNILRAITCTLVIIRRNSRNKFIRCYLENQNDFPNFLLQFWNLNKILSILKKKTSFIPSIFRELLILSNVVIWMPESPVSEHLLEVNVLMSPQHCSSPHSSTFSPAFH